MDKRKLIGSFALASAIGFGVLFGGGGEDPIMGSYRGGYYGQSGSYSGGFVDASFDTLNYLFMYAGLDTNTHNDPDFADAVAAADSIIILTDPVAEFAHIMVDRAQPNTAIAEIQSGSLIYRYYDMDTGVAGDYMDITAGTNNVNEARRVSMFHIAFENYIDANDQIVNGTLHTSTGGVGASVGDTTFTVLMTSVSDSLWWQTVGLANPNLDNVSHACWNRQQVPWAGGLFGYAESYPDSSDWSPAIEDRNRFWEWGDYADASGYTGNVGNIANLDITNCVQGAVNGAVNNGIATVHIAQSTLKNQRRFFNWEPSTLNIDNEPWVTVKFLTKRYVAPLPGNGQVAYLFILDGGQTDIHHHAAAEFTIHGGKFTSNIRGKNLRASDGDTTFATIGELIAWYDAGLMEIACHTWEGISLADYSVIWSDDILADATNYTVGMYPSLITIGDTDTDRFLFTVDPEWMFYEFEVETGESWRNKPLFAETIAHGVSNPSPEGVNAIQLFGYVGSRSAISDKNAFDLDGNFDPWSQPLRARGDTLRTGFIPQNIRRPQNVTFLGMSDQSSDFVGARVDDPSEAQVKYNFRMAFEMARANKRRVVSFFTHNAKAGGDDPGKTTGVDRDELGWSLDALDETVGGITMTVGELAIWRKAYSTAVATPLAYGQSDTFKFTADQDVWGVPDGMDNTFIPGVK